MQIQAMNPAMARESWDSAGDARDEVHLGAAAAMRVLRELIPWSGYALTAWEAVSGTHRHVTLASEGYSDALQAHVNDAFIRTNPAFAIAHTKAPGALRWRDYARDWNLQFAETPSAAEFLIPAGFHEGTTMCLRLPTGRYTGALHVSWASPRDATDEARAIIERFKPLLAVVCDMLRSASTAVERLGPDTHAVLVDRAGTVGDMPGTPVGPVLSDGSPLRRALSRYASHLRNLCCLLSDAEGRCHRIETIPCHGGVTVVTERVVPWPFGITAREAQVLHLITIGLSNPDIAGRLHISTRTVSTHVERILGKLGCSSRAQLAAVAVRENLVLAAEVFGLDLSR